MSKLTIYEIEEELLKSKLEINNLYSYLKSSDENIKYSAMLFIKDNLETNETAKIDNLVTKNYSEIANLIPQNISDYSPEFQIYF